MIKSALWTEQFALAAVQLRSAIHAKVPIVFLRFNLKFFDLVLQQRRYPLDLGQRLLHCATNLTKWKIESNIFLHFQRYSCERRYRDILTPEDIRHSSPTPLPIASRRAAAGRIPDAAPENGVGYSPSSSQETLVAEAVPSPTFEQDGMSGTSGYHSRPPSAQYP